MTKLNKESISLILSIIAIVTALVSCIISFQTASLHQKEFTSDRRVLLTAQFDKDIDGKVIFNYFDQKLTPSPELKLKPSSDNTKILRLEVFYPSKMLENDIEFSKQSSFVVLGTNWINLEPIVMLIKKFHSDTPPPKHCNGVDSEVMTIIKSTYVVKNHQFQQVSFYKIRYFIAILSNPENNEPQSYVTFHGFEWVSDLNLNEFDKALEDTEDDKMFILRYHPQK